MKRLALFLTTLFGVLIVLLVIRTATFRSRQLHPPPAPELQLDQYAVMKRLAEAVQFKTIFIESVKEQLNTDPFRNFHAFLVKSFPRIHKELTKEVVNDRSLLYTWKGKEDRLKPILILAHMDVVPVDPDTEKSWTHGPFSGQVADGYVWGRGTIDDKASLLGMLEAVERLLTDGFQPQRTIYIAFGHDEESGGQQGAAKIAALLGGRGVQIEAVFDEGSGIVNGIIPGVAAPVAMIGIGEKGYLTLELTVRSPGGHSSLPPKESAIGILSRAIDKVERTPFPSRLNDAVKEFFNFVGPELSWDKQLLLANLWLTEPWLERELAKSPLTDSMIRTTKATTIFHAGDKENVLPARAQATMNFRLISGDTVDAVIARVRRTIDDTRVKVTPRLFPIDPSSISSIDADGFKVLIRTISEVAPETIVAPFLTIAATDTRHYAGLTKNIYRFVPVVFRPEDTERIHGVNERISFADYLRCIRFYAQLIKNSDK